MEKISGEEKGADVLAYTNGKKKKLTEIFEKYVQENIFNGDETIRTIFFQSDFNEPDNRKVKIEKAERKS